MSKILQVAWREFIATVATKGFIIGILITPAIIGVMIIVMPILINEKPPEIKGQLALVDRTGEVVEGVGDYLAPEAIAERWDEKKERAAEELSDQVEQLAGSPATEEVLESALRNVPIGVPMIEVVALSGDADLEAEKQPLRDDSDQDGGRLALVVVHDDAVQKASGKRRHGAFDMYVREKLDDRIVDEIRDALEYAIVGARIRVSGYDRDEIESLTGVDWVRSTTVTDEGEQETNEIFNILLPAGFMVLLLVSVITGGQYIMTTTVEEKSSRVVEVLLSAVSPMQLMSGKIIGQMCVGFLILALYAAMGFSALVAFAMLGMIDPWLFLYLVLFYLIAYFIVGSLMAAIGSAVNEMREAQTLMTPVMVTMMIPWLLWMPITRDPNSVFATVTSFIPPINTFVMLLRMTSTSPPPMWQVWLSIAIGVIAVYGALWFAAKVFRVGLLMFGKPPNFATLIKWVRMA